MPVDGGSALCLMLLNPTGGILGGDRLTTEISLGPGTHVCLSTPSATKVYRSLGPPALQETTIALGEGAVLEYLPDHLIPYPGSILHQSLTVEMGPGSRAILADAIAVGRLCRGERWGFSELVSRISITAQGQPRFLDRIRLGSSKWLPEGLGGMEGLGYVATFGLFADSVSNWEKVLHALEEQLRELPSIVGGVSPLARGGCLIRLLAASAPDLSKALLALWALSRHLLLTLPPLDLRKF
jgi:urease accessory protein